MDLNRSQMLFLDRRSVSLGAASLSRRNPVGPAATQQMAVSVSVRSVAEDAYGNKKSSTLNDTGEGEKTRNIAYTYL